MPPPIWTGRLLNGHSATVRQVRVEPAAGALVITQGDGVTLRWPYDQVRPTQGRYDGEQIRLEHGPDPAAALVITDQRFLSALRTQAPGLVSVVHDPARRALRIKLTLVAAIVTVLATGVLYRWGIPGLASLITPHVPISWERHLGEQVVTHLAPQAQRCTDPYRSEIMESLLTRLTATVPESPYTSIQVHIVDDPMVNAFAAPGGYVVVFRGLLELTESAEQLAGVLAHELQHIYRRHTTRAILEHTSTSLLIAAVSGDFTGAATLALDSARTLGSLQYSRDHEAEADAEGMKMLMAAGVNPAGMIEFFELMKKDGHADDGIFQYVSTHPSHQARIERLTHLGSQGLGRGDPLLPGLDWKFIRGICRIKPHRTADALPAQSVPGPGSRT